MIWFYQPAAPVGWECPRLQLKIKLELIRIQIAKLEFALTELVDALDQENRDLKADVYRMQQQNRPPLHNWLDQPDIGDDVKGGGAV